MKNVPTGSNLNTVNVAVNDPKDSDGTVGVNYPTTNGGEIYVGTRAGADGALDKDSFSALFSHEIAEAMTSAVQVTDPGHFNMGNQIADNEPEARVVGGVRGYYAQVPGSYTDSRGKRVSTTNLVQAYWSQKDGAFIVPTDGGPGKGPARPHAGEHPAHPAAKH